MPMLMKAPPNFGGFSVGPTKYQVDTTGHAWVETDHIEIARSHGFTDAAPEVREEAKVPAVVTVQDLEGMFRMLMAIHGAAAMSAMMTKMIGDDDVALDDAPSDQAAPGEVDKASKMDMIREAQALGIEFKATISKRKLAELIATAKAKAAPPPQNATAPGG